jgi:hypothetical protein
MVVLTGDELYAAAWTHLSANPQDMNSEHQAQIDLADTGNYTQHQSLSAADIETIKAAVAVHSGAQPANVPLPHFVVSGSVINFDDYLMA